MRVSRPHRICSPIRLRKTKTKTKTKKTAWCDTVTIICFNPIGETLVYLVVKTMKCSHIYESGLDLIEKLFTLKLCTPAPLPPPPNPPEMTCGFLMHLVFCKKKMWFRLVTSQLRHSLGVHPLLKKILDPPL